MEQTSVKGKTQVKGVLMLLLTSLIWGSSFVAQSVGMESIEAFTFSGIRILMGAFALLPVVLFRNAQTKKKLDETGRKEHKKKLYRTILCGIPVGLVFFCACNFQQFAFNYSTSGKIAFITALYMFFVPIFGLFIRKRVPVLTWICVVFGFIGLGFLCLNPQELTAINKGDMLTFICAVFYAIHILLVERYSDSTDGVLLSCVQFFVGGILSSVAMFIFETPDISAIRTALPSLLYSGIMSCGVAYTFQIIGQKYTEATVASLIMCLESVFGVLTGVVILHETLTLSEGIGCVIMLGAIVLSQFSDKLSPKLFKKDTTETEKKLCQ